MGAACASGPSLHTVLRCAPAAGWPGQCCVHSRLCTQAAPVDHPCGGQMVKALTHLQAFPSCYPVQPGQLHLWPLHDEPRLANSAVLGWVHYRSRSHIHRQAWARLLARQTAHAQTEWHIHIYWESHPKPFPWPVRAGEGPGLLQAFSSPKNRQELFIPFQ